jgi:hypothetical protein
MFITLIASFGLNSSGRPLSFGTGMTIGLRKKMMWRWRGRYRAKVMGGTPVT